MPQSSKYLVHLSAFAAMLIWGMSYSWSKIVFDYLGPASTVMVRLIISSVFLTLLLRLLSMRLIIQREHLGFFLVSALFNPFFYFLGENFGLNLVSPTVSAVIIATIPVFTPVAAYFFLSERLKLLNILGIAISFFGILAMIFDINLNLSASLPGVLLLFGAVVSAVIYGIMLKRLTALYHPMTVVWAQNIIGMVYFIPVVIIFETDRLQVSDINTSLVLNLALLGILASSIAYVFFIHSVKILGIAKANVYTNLIPVFAAIFSYFMIGEIITFDKIIAILFVIAGVYLSQKNK
ncbi:MAG: DMT family transporter [Bacteroidales bacterium]|nr:DMT family transporter [Bacteroidales bacterium]